ncbi:MAG: Ig-like domain-containing protein [Pseudomonas sp.]|uniref:Ig-like domain-containing protein n=1 Tax=Pseudomonas sp. TaxID=306 RepID=UPI00238E4CD3|nr:Ig-like domain-containing protein [Pseudomonas sp.]MDE1198934.1 Ig-like domain-containing protein [Pseudomonas sp.]
MVTSKSGTAQTNIEQVEIFNGDQLLGSVPLVAGQWTYSPSGLSVGSYSLTARCRGVESVTWQLRVDQPGVIDDFEDLQVEYYGLQRLIRPLFIAQFYTVTGLLCLSV